MNVGSFTNCLQDEEAELLTAHDGATSCNACINLPSLSYAQRSDAAASPESTNSEFAEAQMSESCF